MLRILDDDSARLQFSVPASGLDAGCITQPKTMLTKAIVFTIYGSADGLELKEVSSLHVAPADRGRGTGDEL